MGLMCRPSPVFIEIAQKIAVWNETWSSYDGGFGTYYQTRGKAWGIRSLAHAIFLTPDGDAWKPAGRSALFRNTQLLKAFQDDLKSALGFVWDFAPGYVFDYVAARGGNGFTQPLLGAPLSGHRGSQGGQCKASYRDGTVGLGCRCRLGSSAAGPICERSTWRRVAHPLLPDTGRS